MNAGAFVIKNSPCVSRYAYFVINLLKCLIISVKNVPPVSFDLGGSHTGQFCELKEGPTILDFVPFGKNSVHVTVFSMKK